MSDINNLKELAKRIFELLPGTDCKGLGGCGKENCADCAESIAEGGSVDMCPACDQKAVDAIAQITGKQSVERKKKIAFVACSGKTPKGKGCSSCREAKDLGFERGECASGCLGGGSCIEVCTFEAMSSEDGRIIIDKEKCTGCMACAHPDACVQRVISMIPEDATNFIPCSSCEEDEDIVRKTCGYGCIGCGECERACPAGAVSIVNNHAVINYDLCEGCIVCAVKCKKKIIIDNLHDLAENKEKVAFVACRGGYRAGEVFKSMGFTSCSQAVKSADPKELGLCRTGCTGLGDCTRVCRFDAIHIVNGTAEVDPDKCVGCRDCTYACPKGLISILPYKGAKAVPCSSTEGNDEKREICGVCCVGCGDCAANCPSGAVYIEDGHAVVDPKLCENCNICQYVCSHGVIKERVVPEYIYLQRDALDMREGE